ncbi:metallophosphoesterase [Shimia sp. Alg240-R146]|uniref:metallophosphoesterase n=1 Tax=Shimia sp. Alg240-R146 TaxID=2993449 RepID=UPI0022E1FEDB|nr:metallophosphoesterase [Shimia sp. Alg240-R146]
MASVDIHVQKYSIRPQRWPRGQQLQIGLLADPHVCHPWSPLEFLQEAVEVLQAEQPDLILLLGDYEAHLPFSQNPAEAEVANVLAALSAPLGVYNVFGNHDWRQVRNDPDRYTKQTVWHNVFESADLRTLENSSIDVVHGQTPITLAGLGSQMAFCRRFRRPVAGRDDLGQTLRQTDPDRFTILMAHEPDVFATLPKHVDLTVSGHTHGGQVLPFGRPIYVPSKFGTRFAYGAHNLDDRWLVVSRGLGCSGLPWRWGAPPEITMVELT